MHTWQASRSVEGIIIAVLILLSTSTDVTAHPYDLNASDIRAESVLLKWSTTENNVEEFKVHCSGIRHYITMYNEPHTEVDVLTHYVPGALNHVLMGNIQANFNYSCMITEQLDSSAHVLGSRVSKPFHFATDYSNPEKPKMPEVHQQEDTPIEIVLFPVSTRFGPILGYKVQFHALNGLTPDGAPIINDEMLVPFGKFSPGSHQDAAVSTIPKSFQLTYDSNNLPHSISIDSGLLMGALKSKAVYSAVTVAYSKTKREMELNPDGVLFSASKPSHPFIARGYTQMESVAGKSSSIRPRQLFVAISVGVILPLLVISYVICVGVYLLIRKHRLRIQQRKVLITREDIMEASQLRKTQRHNDMPWIQDSPGMGDLPWLDPDPGNNNTPSLLTEQSQSTPNSQPSSASQLHSHSSRNQTKGEPVQADYTGITSRRLAGQMGHTLSEPTTHDISNFHPPKQTYISTHDTHPPVTPHHPNLHIYSTNSLPYITTTEQKEDNLDDGPVEAHIPSQQHTIQSPTKFFSAADFSSEHDDDAQLSQERNGKISLHASSSMFIPRGLSSSSPLIAQPGAQPSPIQTLFSQLSQGSLSEQEDQAPDMEMDLYDITIN